MSTVIRAARANALLSVLGLVISSATLIVVTRSLDQKLYADYASLMAIVSFCLLLTEAGGNTGFMRYLHQAEQQSGRGTLYLALARGRVYTGLALVALLSLAGPLWAHWSRLPADAWGISTFLLIAGTVAAGLLGKLAHAGLIGTFRHADALALSHGVTIARALLLCAVAVFWPSLEWLAAVVFLTAVVEAVWYHARIWPVLRGEREPIPPALVAASRRHGLASAYDKVTSLVGGGPFLLLALAPAYGRVEIALLAVAADVVQKGLAVVSLPMGNLVLPYLNQASRDHGSLALAVGKMTEVSSLIFVPALGALLVFFPAGIPYVFGEAYAGAAPLAALLVFPVFLDGWVRFVLVSSLLTKGCYRQVSIVNTLQAVLALVVLFATYRHGFESVILGQGVVKVVSSGAIIYLAARERLLPRLVIAHGLLGTTVVAGAAGVAVGWGIPRAGFGYGYGGAIAMVSVYAAVFWLGLRFRVRLSADLADRLDALFGRRRWAQLILPRAVG